MNFKRKPNRLPIKNLYQKGYWYFVTICVQNKKCIFVEAMTTSPKSQTSEIKSEFITQNNQFQLNQAGKIVETTWLDIPKYFDNLVLDEYVVMPNHFHGIVGFDEQPVSKITNKNVDLSNIIRSFKTIVTKQIKSLVSDQSAFGDVVIAATWELLNKHKTIWQKSFFDHIIRN